MKKLWIKIIKCFRWLFNIPKTIISADIARGDFLSCTSKHYPRTGVVKTCNGGYCNYKTFDGSNPGCSYTGYCDYQCPKDSRVVQMEYTPVETCLCACSDTLTNGCGYI